MCIRDSNKEYAHQTDLVKAAREYLGALDDIDVAKEMLHLSLIHI